MTRSLAPRPGSAATREMQQGPTLVDQACVRRTVSIMNACASVGVSRRTIYNWMAAGKVQYVRTAGGAVRIFEDTLWRDADPTTEARQ